MPGLEEPLPLPCGAGLSEGVAACLAVRPEKLALSRTRPAGFAIAATVSSVGYFGGGSIVHLAAGQGHLLKAYLPSACAGSFGRSTPAWASWRPSMEWC